MSRNRKTLVIYTKEPQAGRVKTRLGRDIGMVTSAWWFRHTARKLFRTLAHKNKWQTVIAVAPYTALFSQEYARYDAIFQGSGTLEHRLRRTFQRFLQGDTVIIGTDCPDITEDQIAQAFVQLGSHDLVLGPAHDGGYWLIGIKGARALPLQALKNIRWSSCHTLEDTVNSFPRSFRVTYLEILRDVDTAADLQHNRS